MGDSRETLEGNDAETQEDLSTEGNKSNSASSVPLYPLFWLKARLQLERKAYECIRVNGDIICRWCKKPYYKHRAPFEWCPTMVIDCEGRQLKL